MMTWTGLDSIFSQRELLLGRDVGCSRNTRQMASTGNSTWRAAGWIVGIEKTRAADGCCASSYLSWSVDPARSGTFGDAIKTQPYCCVNHSR
jgi:hypothetical protein